MSKRRLSEDSDDDKRYFLNPEAVSVHLFCSICQEVFVCPQRAPCGHSFCKKCIMPWLQKSKTCPEDRKPLQLKDMHHDFIVENIIGDQMVACRFRRRGCTHIGQLSQCTSHIRVCTFNPANLPDFLRADIDKTSSRVQLDTSTTDSESEAVPTPAKPSLRMRLFQAGGMSRDLLCSAFDEKSRSSSTSSLPLTSRTPLCNSSVSSSRT